MEKEYRYFETLDSTQLWAKEHLKSLSQQHLTLVWADELLGAYGQKKRPWIAPRGEGLWVTFCFWRDNPDGFVTTRHMAESIVQILAEEGIEGFVKWPNDIFVQGKKIAGILTEIVDDFVLVGVGWNVNMPQETLEKIDQPATSLLAETGKNFSSKEVLDRLSDLFLKKADINR